MRSEARASDLNPNFPEYKPPTLSYETHPNDLKFGYSQAFRGRILTIAHTASTDEFRQNIRSHSWINLYNIHSDVRSKIFAKTHI